MITPEEPTDATDATDETEASDATASRLATVLLSCWRRLVAEEDGIELTLPEAAAILGVSVDTVRRHIKRGELATRKDARGRVRVMPVVPEAAPQPQLTQLHDELAQTQQALREALWQQAALTAELETLRQAGIERNPLAAWAPLLHSWPIGEPENLEAQRQQRRRISAKIDEARRLAGSRSHVIPASNR